MARIPSFDLLPMMATSFRRSISEGGHELHGLTAEALHDASANTFESSGHVRPIAMLRNSSRSSFLELVEESPSRLRDSTPSSAAGEKHDAWQEQQRHQRSDGPKLSIFLGSRCTRVHFVRHAEGFHNVVTREAGKLGEAVAQAAADAASSAAVAAGTSAAEASGAAKKAYTAAMRVEENRPVHFATPGAERFTDAELTEAGRNQCYALRGKIDRNRVVAPLDRLTIDLVVVSPLRRCLETADIIFGPARREGRPELKPFLVHDMCRERYGEFYCDSRLPVSETREDPRWRSFDWDTMKTCMSDHIMPYTDADEAWQEEREPEEHVMGRAQHFLQWLAHRPERELAVVTHSSFLKNLFKVFGGDTSKSDQDVLRAVPANCELRTVVLCHHG